MSYFGFSGQRMHFLLLILDPLVHFLGIGQWPPRLVRILKIWINDVLWLRSFVTDFCRHGRTTGSFCRRLQPILITCFVPMSKEYIISIFYPLGQPTQSQSVEIIIFTRIVRLSSLFKILQNKFLSGNSILFVTGVTVGLAERIIDYS